jgi:hypothetical protein
MKIEIHKAERLVPEKSAFEFEIVTEKIKITGMYPIPAQLIKAGYRTINFKVDKLDNLFVRVIIRNYSCNERFQ